MVLGKLKGLFGAHIGVLKEAGNLESSDWLQPVSSATTLKDGGNCVQDGPFAETKETLGGYRPSMCLISTQPLHGARNVQWQNTARSKTARLPWNPSEH